MSIGEVRSLHGRRRECEALDRLVETARAGRSQVLVLRGEAGIGKTALLGHLLERAAGCQIARSAGIETEMELPFAGLHQLCLPFLARVRRLPEPQQEALGTAFGLTAGPPPDRFFVALAVLSLLSDVAEEKPLICLVDDAQWLDDATAQTLAFVARRLLAESIGLVFAVRSQSTEERLSGLPELLIRGLSDAHARELLGSTVPGPLDPAVRDEIVAEARGNPLALLELPRGLSPAELTFGPGLPSAKPLASRLEEGFLRQLEPLPEHSRRLLLAAAVEPVGDVTLLWRVAERLGIGPDAATPASAAGLIEFGDRVRFRHPLVRSAAYRAAGVRQLREVHLALAQVTDAAVDPDRRAWHLAHAAVGPDEQVAGELESSAGRAHARGGLAAEAALLEKAADLTPDPARRTARILAAAQVQHRAGAAEAALRLLTAAEARPLNELQRADADLLRAQVAFVSSHGQDAPRLLLAAARRLEPLDATRSRDTYRDALSAALFVGRLGGDVGVLDVARACRAAPPSSGNAPDLLLDGLAMLITEGPPRATPLLQRAVRAFRTEDLSEGEAIRWLWLATHAAHDLWDDESWDALSARHIELARKVGALTVLPLALSAQIGLRLFAGDLRTAASLIEEVAAVREVTGNRLPPYGPLELATRRGREAEATTLIREVTEQLTSRGEGMGLTLVLHATALLANGAGRYHEALAAAEQAVEHRYELGFASLSLPELIEAAARSGQASRATGAMKQLTDMARTSGTDWVLGVERRSRALLSQHADAESYYREAIDCIGRTRLRMELARTHLLYGEWLRRAGRRLDAREQLRTAHTMLAAMGADGFAERARRELTATGERARKRPVEARDELTAQEAQVARLAAEGQTNPEIGAQLFLSPRTVEWHLRKVYTKLSLTSRRELIGAVLPSSS